MEIDLIALAKLNGKLNGFDESCLTSSLLIDMVKFITIVDSESSGFQDETDDIDDNTANLNTILNTLQEYKILIPTK